MKGYKDLQHSSAMQYYQDAKFSSSSLEQE